MNGSTSVSKTVDLGSIPSAPAIWSLNLVIKVFYFVEKCLYGILANIELGKYCQNKDCEEFDTCSPFEHDYCAECGKKNRIHNEKDIHSIFELEKAKKILEYYTVNSNLSTCIFVKDPDFDELVEQFKKSKMCKKGIKTIEKAYGEGSAIVRLAYVQYHQNYWFKNS